MAKIDNEQIHPTGPNGLPGIPQPHLQIPLKINTIQKQRLGVKDYGFDFPRR